MSSPVHPVLDAQDRLQRALAGRYSVEREIGRGAMGIVYLAYDIRLERPVAIKVLPPLIATHDILRERFLREARTAARLAHPNIVPIHGIEEHDELICFVMAFIAGETLRERGERGQAVEGAGGDEIEKIDSPRGRRVGGRRS
jgi:serine/threonine protein kinase